MQLMSKEKAIEILIRTIEERSKIPNDGSDSTFDTWYTWARNVDIRVSGIFGSGSPQAKEVSPLTEKIYISDSAYTRRDAARPIVALVKSLLVEVVELWPDGTYQSDSDIHDELTPNIDVETNSNRVFVVHGHDYGRMQAVARFLEHLELEPIILHERANIGDTIIEKLERHSTAAYAVILLTPDDVGSIAANRDNLQFRARQNVILELGYFIAKLGRNRTAALVVEGVEIPSDYSGILYIPVGRGDEWKLLLAREMRAAGIEIDLNRVV